MGRSGQKRHKFVPLRLFEDKVAVVGADLVPACLDPGRSGRASSSTLRSDMDEGVLELPFPISAASKLAIENNQKESLAMASGCSSFKKKMVETKDVVVLATKSILGSKKLVKVDVIGDGDSSSGGMSRYDSKVLGDNGFKEIKMGVNGDLDADVEGLSDSVKGWKSRIQNQIGLM